MLTPTPPHKSWGQLAVTAALVVGVAALGKLDLGLPGVDVSGVVDNEGRVPQLGVFALGIMPLLSAMALVEMAALLVPRWRPLRHGGPEGRRKLGRAALVVTAALCAFQGFGLMRLARGMAAATGAISVAGGMTMVEGVVTLTAGTLLLAAVAQWAGERGIAGGIAVVWVSAEALDVGRGLFEDYARAAVTPEALAAAGGGAALVVVVTWAALRSPAEGAAEGRAMQVPAPAAGVVPLFLAGSALAVAGTLRQVGVPLGLVVAAMLSTKGAPGPWDDGGVAQRAIPLVVTVTFALALARVFNAPARVAALHVRARPRGNGASLVPEARALGREAGLRAAAFVVAVAVIAAVAFPAGRAPGMILALACGTAVLMDGAAEWRARRTMPDPVAIWPEHRPYAIPAAREALARAGIAVHARGERLRRLLQFGGPFAPVDLFVPRTQADQAASVLAEVLLYRAEDTEGETRSAAEAARPWARREVMLAGASGAICLAAIFLPRDAATLTAARAHARPEALQLVAVDDDDDPFDLPPGDMPEGLSVETENVPLGPERTAPRRFMRVLTRPGESLDQARARLLAWAELRGPAGGRVLPQALAEYDPEHERVDRIGWRTMVVSGRPIVDGGDVDSARAMRADSVLPGWTVHVDLRPQAAERFRAFTASHRKRRMAIVVDGVVESAPVILSEIPGGRVQIAMGAGDEEEQRETARRLEARLLGR